MARTYNQECVLAYALDLLGERWTMLILRELFLGPRRFGDLHAALPGIGTNLLSKRLKELEEAELVMPTSAEARSQYKLTDYGEDLRPMVRSMMHWSINYFMSRPGTSAPKECIFSNDLQPDSVALAIEMFSNKNTIPHHTYVLHLIIDEHSYTFYFMNDELTAKRGADAPAAARIETDTATLMKAMRGEIYIEQTIASATISGDQDLINHFVANFTAGADIAFEVASLIEAHKEEIGAVKTPPSPQQSTPNPKAIRPKEVVEA